MSNIIAMSPMLQFAAYLTDLLLKATMILVGIIWLLVFVILPLCGVNQTRTPIRTTGLTFVRNPRAGRARPQRHRPRATRIAVPTAWNRFWDATVADWERGGLQAVVMRFLLNHGNEERGEEAGLLGVVVA